MKTGLDAVSYMHTISQLYTLRQYVAATFVGVAQGAIFARSSEGLFTGCTIGLYQNGIGEFSMWKEGTPQLDEHSSMKWKKIQTPEDITKLDSHKYCNHLRIP